MSRRLESGAADVAWAAHAGLVLQAGTEVGAALTIGEEAPDSIEIDGNAPELHEIYRRGPLAAGDYTITTGILPAGIPLDEAPRRLPAQCASARIALS